MSILIATLKPGPPGRDWSNFVRLRLLNTGGQKTWELDSGNVQLFPNAHQGAWTYEMGDITIRTHDSTQSLILHNVHWNFEILCTRQDLTGRGSRQPGSDHITWVL